MDKQNIKLQEYIKFLDFNETIILRDETVGVNLNIKLDNNFYYGKTNLSKLARFFAEHLDIKKVDSKNHVTVDLYGLFNNEKFIKYAEKSISNVYALIDDYETAAYRLTYDVVHYMNVGADKFCSRVLECFDYMDGTKEFYKDQIPEEKSYYIINVSKGITAGEGYDIYLELDNNANEQDAVDKAVKDCLFDEPEDVGNIFSVEKVTEEAYREFTGGPLETFKIPVVFQSSGFIEVKGSSLDNAVKYAEKHLDKFKLPENPQYIEDSFEIDYGSIEGLKENVVNKGQSLDNRIADADKKKSAVIESKNIQNEISK